MRNLSTSISGILILALVQSPYALASEASTTFKEGMQDRQRGVKDVVTSPTHVVKDTAAGIEGDHPVGGTAKGVVTGTAKTGGQVIQGAGNVVNGTGKMLTAPVKAVTP